MPIQRPEIKAILSAGMHKNTPACYIINWYFWQIAQQYCVVYVDLIMN